MKKYIVKVFFIIIVIICIFSNIIYADFGPKPSVNIKFKGIEGTFYVTLLSKSKRYGPWSLQKDNMTGTPDDIYSEFVSYKDDDSYNFIGYIEDCTDKEFDWSYYAPENFKILIYIPNQDKFIISDKNYERYAYNSYYFVEIKDNKIVKVKNEYNYLREILAFLARVIITIIVEIFIALLFGIRSADNIKIIIWANIFTQGLLNLIISIFNYKSGFFFPIYILTVWIFEIIIFIIEGLVYKKYIKNLNHPFLYSFVANFMTYILGFIIIMFLPWLYVIV